MNPFSRYLVIPQYLPWYGIYQYRPPLSEIHLYSTCILINNYVVKGVFSFCKFSIRFFIMLSVHGKNVVL